MQCSKCNASNTSDSFYCRDCGHKLKRKDKFDEYEEKITSLNDEKSYLYDKINSLRKKNGNTELWAFSFAVFSVIVIIFAIYFYITKESAEKTLTQKITILTDEKDAEIGLKNDTINNFRNQLKEKQKDIASKHNEIVNLKSNLENKLPKKYKVTASESYCYYRQGSNFVKSIWRYNRGQNLDVYVLYNSYGLTFGGWLKMSDLEMIRN